MQDFRARAGSVMKRLGGLAGLLLWCCIGTPAEAQSLLAAKERYVEGRLALSFYAGDRTNAYDSRWQALEEAAGGGIGVAGGFFLSPRWSVGAYLLSNRYPYLLYVDRQHPSIEPIRPGESSDWIHHLGLLWRRRLPPVQEVTPYLMGGGGVSLSLLNRHILIGLSPRFGGGADLDVTGTARLFAEFDAVLVAPGNAMDLAGSVAGVDLFTHFSFGLRYRLPAQVFAKEKIPLQLDVFGPKRLAPGDEGLYAADVRPEGLAAELSYRWDFGDGHTAETRVARHRYTQPGAYTVRLRVAGGGKVEERSLLTLVPEPVQSAEVVAIRSLPLRPRTGEAVSFSVVLNGTGPFTCRWDFGDGVRAEGCEVTHRYALPGNYAVALEASNTHSAAQGARQVAVREDPCADLTRLHPVYFAWNESTLDANARGFLRENIAQLLACPGVGFEVRGRAEPSETSPEALAAARARAVVQYYINLGIPSGRITVTDQGQVPVVPEGHAVWQYRSVESVPGLE